MTRFIEIINNEEKIFSTIYVADVDHIDSDLLPFDWYKELVLIGARAHNFPGEYIDKIDAVIARQDLDSRRSADRWKTVEKVRAGT